MENPLRSISLRNYLTIGSTTSGGPLWYFNFLTADFLDSVVDSQFQIAFSLEGARIGQVDHITNYGAADNGGTNSQPILTCVGRGEITTKGFRLLLQGNVGAYDELSLGVYGTKHKPGKYEFEIACSSQQFAELVCEKFVFSSKHNFKKEDLAEDCPLQTSHSFSMADHLHGLYVYEDDDGVHQNYSFSFVDSNFLYRNLSYPDFK